MNLQLLATLVKVLVLSLVILLPSCKKENIEITKEYPGVASELWSYLERFEEAAQSRGLSVDIAAAGISAEIGETVVSNWVGQCNHNHGSPNHIIINNHFWQTASEMRKEKIIFHELGHCYLERDHVEDILPDGRCKSLMRSGNGTCIDNYTSDTRDYYLDELFVF